MILRRLAHAVDRRYQEWRCGNEHQRWLQRIHDVTSCPDNQRIPRVPEAGSVRDGFQLMHNGIEVLADGYYGAEITQMLASNRGCHEPQEEALFGPVIESLPEAAVIIEAGSYWGFYSLWFVKAVHGARAYLIEPDAERLEVGRRNFARNHAQADFTRAWIGSRTAAHPHGGVTCTLDSFTFDHGLAHVHLIHADIQGAEAEMLQGSRNLLNTQAVDYWFISTHSMSLHGKCRQLLESYGYRILVSLDLLESCSVDGLLLAASPAIKCPPLHQPFRRTWSLKSMLFSSCNR